MKTSFHFLSVLVSRYILRIVFACCVLTLANVSPVFAAHLVQDDDPATQCAKGVQLYDKGQETDALPLLESGFTNRNKTQFAKSHESGVCAMVLGLVYIIVGRNNDALSSSAVALQIFRDNNDRIFEADTLNNIGEVYRILKQSDHAIDYYQQALIIYRETKNRSAETITLFNISGMYKDQSQYMEALKYAQQALLIAHTNSNLKNEANTLSLIAKIYEEQKDYNNAIISYEKSLQLLVKLGDLKGQSWVLSNVASIYRSQKQYSQSLEYLQQALKILQKLGNQLEEAETLNLIGDIYDEENLYADALDSYSQSLKILQAIDDKPSQFTAFSNIGHTYRLMGEFSKSVDAYQKALTIAQETNNLTRESRTLGNLGTLYTDQGKYSQALQADLQALDISREAGDRQNEGAILNTLGAIYSYQGQYSKALDYLQQALGIRHEVGDRFGEGVTRANIGLLYRNLGQYDLALNNLQQALIVEREVDNRVGESIVLGNIGGTYYFLEKYDQALKYYQDSLEISQEIGDRDSESSALNNIGLLYTDEKLYSNALEAFQQSLDITRDLGIRDSESVTLSNIGNVYQKQGMNTKALEFYQQALVIARELGNQETESKTLISIGSAYRDQDLYADALAAYEQAMTTLEFIRASSGSEFSRASFSAQYTLFYNKVIELYVQQNQPEKAFLASERGRARAFLDSVATGYVEFNDDATALLYAAEQETYAKWQSAQNILNTIQAQKNQDEKLISALKMQLEQAEKDHQAALDAIATRGDQLQQLVPGRSKVLDVPQAQALLDDQTTLLSFWVLDDQTFVFLLTQKTFDAIILPISRKELYAQIQAFRSFANTKTAFPESAAELYHVLIEPLKSKLTTPHLVIVPNGELNYLPFAALTDGKHYLADDFVVTYIPSVSTLPYIKDNRQEAGKSVLLIGTPATEDAQLAPLPFAEKEVQGIARLYGIKPLVGSAATESQLKQQAAQMGILHVAAHGNYNTENPLYSTLYLAPDAENDGFLEVHEVYKLDLHKTNLVVLSACETQLGELSSGDELVGLTRAFFFAGTPTVVASLWSVDDEATSMLMEQFYTHIRVGLGKAEALRKAQIDVRAKYPNPYYWSGFVLSGDAGKTEDSKPQPVSPKSDSSSSDTPWVILFCCICGTGLGGLVVIGGFLLMRRRRKSA